MNTTSEIVNGRCTCGHVHYQTTAAPLIVHACHCRGCQQNSGSAFALNALVEANQVTLVSGEVEEILVPTPGGTGQDIARCVKCKVAVWSNYNFGGPLRKFIRFIRVGTLDDPDQMPPDIHIYTCSKQPWMIIPENDQRVDEFYDVQETWSLKSLKRLTMLKETTGI